MEDAANQNQVLVHQNSLDPPSSCYLQLIQWDSRMSTRICETPAVDHVQLLWKEGLLPPHLLTSLLEEQRNLWCEHLTLHV